MLALPYLTLPYPTLLMPMPMPIVMAIVMAIPMAYWPWKTTKPLPYARITTAFLTELPLQVRPAAQDAALCFLTAC